MPHLEAGRVTTCSFDTVPNTRRSKSRAAMWEVPYTLCTLLRTFTACQAHRLAVRGRYRPELGARVEDGRREMEGLLFDLRLPLSNTRKSNKEEMKKCNRARDHARAQVTGKGRERRRACRRPVRARMRWAAPIVPRQTIVAVVHAVSLPWRGVAGCGRPCGRNFRTCLAVQGTLAHHL